MKDEYKNEVRDMIADGLRAMSEYSAWWFAVAYNKRMEINDREYVSRLSGLLGYK